MSNRTTALNKNQFDLIVRHFEEAQDFRMLSICLLMAKCVRIGDVLETLKIKDVYTSNGTLRDRIIFKEQKTSKPRTLSTGTSTTKLHNALISHYKTISTLKTNSPIFFTEKRKEPLQPSGVKYLLRQFIGLSGIEQCSPHSFRKFGAKYLHNQGIDIETISQVLNHSSVTQTRVYLDIKPKEVERAMNLLNF